MRLLVSFSRL